MALKIQPNKFVNNNPIPTTIRSSSSLALTLPASTSNFSSSSSSCWKKTPSPLQHLRRRGRGVRISARVIDEAPLDLTEDNVNQVLLDARTKFGQIFDVSAGMTGEAELAELDGPFVKIRLRGRFWHERSMVLARLANYLKHRIPEILEVDIEDEKQLDDSPDNF